MLGWPTKRSEEIGVAEVAEVGGGPLPELLLEGGEPALGAFPGVVGAVEVVRAIGARLAGGEEEDVGGVVGGVGPES